MEHDTESERAHALEIVWTDDSYFELVPVVEEILRSHATLIAAAASSIVVVRPYERFTAGDPTPVRVQIDERSEVVRVTIGTSWDWYPREVVAAYFLDALVAAQVDHLAGPMGRYLAQAIGSTRPVMPGDTWWWAIYKDFLVAHLTRALRNPRTGRGLEEVCTRD